MKDPVIHLHIIGILFSVLSLMHIVFPKRFEWKKELSGLGLLNRQMMYIHTFFIALFVMLNGLLFIFYSEDLMQKTPLSRALLAGLMIFWGIRGICQHFIYSSTLWRGKRLETGIHVLFSLFWLYVVFVLGWILKINYA